MWKGDRYFYLAIEKLLDVGSLCFQTFRDIEGISGARLLPSRTDDGNSYVQLFKSQCKLSLFGQPSRS